eukprot:m.171591 g.171591  ORF g.171591 m.171591 type:complete len:65 (-) comp14553_c0_seq5:115-309(-)
MNQTTSFLSEIQPMPPMTLAQHQMRGRCNDGDEQCAQARWHDRVLVCAHALHSAQFDFEPVTIN